MRNLAVTIALLLCTQSAMAESGSVIHHLMESKASEFDVGMLRLEIALQAHFGNSDERLFITPLYDPNRDQIVVFATALYGDLVAPDLSENHCTTIVAKIRGFFSVNPQSGHPSLGDTSMVADYFSPAALQKKGPPAGFGQQLDQRVEIKVLLQAMGGEGRRMYCRAPLLGTDVEFPKQ